MSTEYENLKTVGVLLGRFWGGDTRGVCLQLTKPNTWQGEYKQFTLSQAEEFKAELETVKGENVCYKVADNFYLTAQQCETLRSDLDLFIKDSIHR